MQADAVNGRLNWSLVSFGVTSTMGAGRAVPALMFRLFILSSSRGLAAGLVMQRSVAVPRLTCSSGCSMRLADDGVLGVGLIGAGRIGLVHLEALSRCESARAVIISNPTVSKAEEAAIKYKLDHFTGEANDVINHPDVEAVWICSPSQFHAAQIKACAAAGKHVFCEKPIATDLEETIEAVSRSQLRTLDIQMRSLTCASLSVADQRVQRGRRQADDGAAAALRPQLQAGEGGN